MGLPRIIALDLGKFKTVACVMNVADRSHVFETIEMSPRAVHDLLARHATEDRRDTRVVFETCDCAGWVHDVCVSLGLPAVVVSANSEAWRWQRVKRKTDRDDALKLARLCLLDQLTAVHVPEPARRQVQAGLIVVWLALTPPNRRQVTCGIATPLRSAAPSGPLGPALL